MVPIVVLLAILDGGARRVAIRQRQVAVGVGYIHAVKLGQSYGLYDVEALGGAVAQVEVGLLAVETVEKLPRRVPLIEERAAVGILQIVAVSDTVMGRCCSCAAAGRMPAAVTATASTE